MDDEFVRDGHVDEHSLYGGAPHALPGFRRFLYNLMGTQPRLLPPLVGQSESKDVRGDGDGRPAGQLPLPRAQA